MAAPVWVLSVDLQTKTATFQSGLADAAKSARGSFGEIKAGGTEMGGSVNYSMMEARHGVMLLGEEFGVHLPRALTSFIASIGPVGMAMQAAFPFLAIAVGATLLIEHLVKLHEAGEKLTEDQLKFGTTVNNVFNQLDDKLLQAQIRADDLAHNHLAALDDQLKLIDRESMNELVKSFEEIAKAGDVVMKELEGHWYTFGKGSEGAKHALEDFQAHYDNLLSQSKEEQAKGLLHGTLGQAQQALDALKQLQSSGRPGNNPFAAFADPAKYHEAEAALQKLGITTGQVVGKQIEAQQNLVDALDAQIDAEKRAAAIKSLEGKNVKTADTQKDANDAKEKARQLEENLKAGRDVYLSELFETYKQTVSTIQQGEKQNLEGIKSGTAERLAAIEDAMKREEADGLQGTTFYRELYAQRAELQEHLAEESLKQSQEANAEDIKQQATMAELQLAADKSASSARLSFLHATDQQRAAESERLANEEYEIKKRALDRELGALVQSDANYSNKLKQLQNQETLLVQQHANELADIREKAEIATNDKLTASYQRFTSTISGELTKTIMGHQSMTRMVESLGNQMISSMIENTIQYAISNKFRQESDAKAAASAGFKLGMQIGGPAAPVLAPVFAAAAFMGAMAFDKGGIVPGYDIGDTVPAMLTPGETVLPKALSEGLMNAAKGGNMGGDKHYHAHVHPTYNVQTIDGDGMQDVLEKHSDQLQRHVENTLRRMHH